MLERDSDHVNWIEISDLEQSVSQFDSKLLLEFLIILLFHLWIEFLKLVWGWNFLEILDIYKLKHFQNTKYLLIVFSL